nr:hypothetical protein [Acinetobacter sp. NCu2D-2]
MGLDHLVTNEAFSIATLIYARLRRVTGRVIDVAYFTENMEYAKRIADLAVETQDEELLKLIEKLKIISGFDELDESKHGLEYDNEQDLERIEPTDDDIYRAQVSHHYIGALR